MSGLAWLRGLRRTSSSSDSSSVRRFRAGLFQFLFCISLFFGFASGAQAQTLSISAPSTSANEGNSGTQTLTYTVTASAAPSAFINWRVCFSGTATRDEGGTSDPFATNADYRALDSGNALETSACTGTFVFGPILTTTATNISIQVIGDTDIEEDETVVATLSFIGTPPAGVTLGTSVHTHTIENDDTPPKVNFSNTSVNVEEGSSFAVTAWANQALTSDLTVSYTLEGTATAGDDYTTSPRADYNAGTGAFTIPSGTPMSNNVAAFTLTITDDNAMDAGETIVFTIVDGTDYDPGSSSTTTYTTAESKVPRVTSIERQTPSTTPTDADSLTWRVIFDETVVNVDVADFEIDGTTAMLAVDGPDGGRQYDVTASGGNLAGLNATVTLSFATGQNIKDEAGNRLTDTTPTGTNDNSFVVDNTPNYPSTVGTTQTLHILSRSGQVEGSPGVASGYEGGSVFDVDMFAKALTDIEYKMCFSGTATFGEDYQILKGGTPITGNCATGLRIEEDSSAPDDADKIKIKVIKDAVHEPNESVIATLTVTGYPGITDDPDTPDDERFGSYVRGSSKTYTIRNDDDPPRGSTPPVVTISSGPEVKEGQPARFGMKLDRTPTAPLFVNVRVHVPWAETYWFNTVLVGSSAPLDFEMPVTEDNLHFGRGHFDYCAWVVPGDGYTIGGASRNAPANSYDGNGNNCPSGATVRVLDNEPTPAGAQDGAQSQDSVEILPDNPDRSALTDPTACVSPELQSTVEGYTRENYGAAHVQRWKKVLKAFARELGGMTSVEARQMEAKYSAHRWRPVVEAIECLETEPVVPDSDPPPDPIPVILPELSLSSGSGVDEGGNAEFTIASTPAPSSDLEIALTVTQSGDYLTTPEPASRTVTLTAGSTSTTLSFATEDDQTDETDGSVQVTLAPGTDYTIASGQQSGTIVVQDNDEPVVSVTAGDSVTEGDPATFTVSASPVPASPLTVTLTIAQSGEVAVSGQTGSREIVIPTEGSVTVEIPTDDDSTDEADGSITATVLAKDGYTVAASPDDTATVTVTDNDEALTVSVPSLSVEDAQAHESEGRLSFSVRLNPPSKTKVTVWAWLRESDPVSAQEGIDYRSWNAWDATRLIFPAGTTERTLAVPIINDSHDEEAETFEIRLSNATGGALIEKQTGLMTIVNSDPMPAAWLSRFGRTVAQQALDGIATRISAPRNAGTQGALAGQTLNANDSVGRSDSSDSSDTWTPSTRPSVNVADSLTDSFAHPHGFSESRTMSGLDALLGSHFTVTEETGVSGNSLSYWGRAAQSSFDGQEGTFSLDGEATTAMLGMDYARHQWMAGFALMQSDGDGNYTDTDAVREGDGQIEASLTSLIPYTAIQTSPNMKWWGAFGFGTGETTLKPEPGGSYSSDISWNMAALGMRADLIQPDNGPALALTSDALWTNTESDQTQDLAASDSNTTRLRMGLEGNWKTETRDGGHFTPKIEAGVRHDGGDAETGLGLEVGAGLIWTNPNTGLHLDLSGRTLMTHDSDDLKDQGFAAALAFDPQPQSERGWSFSIRQEVGGAAQGGLDALFQEDPLSDRTGHEQSRWTTRAQYGYPAGNGDFTATPQISLGMSTDQRELQLGWSVTPLANQPDWSFTVQTTRREQESQHPVQSVGVGWRVRW